MAKDQNEVLVLYEDEARDIEKVAFLLSERLEELGQRVKVRKASSVSISEILVAKLYFLGADSAKASSFAEVGRLFSGMNLADRRAAFFGSSGAAVAWLHELCADSEISIVRSDLIGRPESAPLSAWLKAVLAS